MFFFKKILTTLNTFVIALFFKCDVMAFSETRITKNKAPIINIDLTKQSYKH